MVRGESIRLMAERLQFIILDKAKCRSPWLLSPLRDLTEHERIGHTCARHVGLPLAVLRQRLMNESRIEVSCFWSIDAARAAVCFLTMDKLSEIIQWIEGRGSRVVLEGSVPTLSSIGYIVTDSGISWANRVRMVLQRLPSSELFGIISAFPIR